MKRFFKRAALVALVPVTIILLAVETILNTVLFMFYGIYEALQGELESIEEVIDFYKEMW